MSDYMVRATAADGQIRAFAITSKEMTEEARVRHNSSPIVTAALGRTMSAAAMMGSMMKGEKDLLTLQIQGDGPMHGLTVTANANGGVKGYPGVADVILPPNAAGKLNVGGAIGNGVLSVIKDMGLKDPYVGQTELQTGEIAEDLTYYFAQSEQTPSSVGLGVLVDVDQTILASGGFLLQLMPNTDQKTIDQLEKNIKNFVGVTPYLSQGHSLEEMMDVLFEGFDHEVTDTMDVSWKCNCSFERGKEVLATLKREEIVNMI